MTFYDDVIHAQEKVKRGSLVCSCNYDIVKHPVRRQFLSYWRKTFNMYCQLSWNQLGKLLYGYWLRRLRKGVRNLRRRFSVETVSFPPCSQVLNQPQGGMSLRTIGGTCVRLSHLHNKTLQKCALAYGCLIFIMKPYDFTCMIYAIVVWNQSLIIIENYAEGQ